MAANHLNEFFESRSIAKNTRTGHFPWVELRHYLLELIQGLLWLRAHQNRVGSLDIDGER